MNSGHIANIPFLSFISTAILLCGVGMVGSRRIGRLINLISLQALFVATLVALVGFAEHEWHFYLVAVFVMLLKGIAAPGILSRVSKKIGIFEEKGMFVGRTASVVFASGFTLLAYYLASQFAETGIPQTLLAVSLDLILLGMFIMVTRKTALMQVSGFLLMENGVFLTAVSTTLGLPLVVEMGIFLDVIVGIAIMALLSNRINDQFAGIETTKLNSLKG
ncbi:MAG TPA: hypothetical protein VNU93_04900 [Verrucomicrobiae bacterium]|nr:hypothetical protein [Verrucomicrobiae bacterium]